MDRDAIAHLDERNRFARRRRFLDCPPNGHRPRTGGGVGNIDRLATYRCGEGRGLRPDAGRECVVGRAPLYDPDAARVRQPCTSDRQEVNEDGPVLAKNLGTHVIAVATVSREIDRGNRASGKV